MWNFWREESDKHYTMAFIYSNEVFRTLCYISHRLDSGIISNLKSINIFRECKLSASICRNKVYFCELKIKDAYKILDVSAIKVGISNFFDVGFVDVFLNHYKVINDVKCLVKLVIRFSSFDDYLGFEDMVLPRD